MDSLLLWLEQQGVEFQVPELLWALLLPPLLLLFFAWARAQRRAGWRGPSGWPGPGAGAGPGPPWGAPWA